MEIIPDAPFRSGVTGKYKLLIRSVTHKFDGYEYFLVDSEGKEYKAKSNLHYGEMQLLRCVVSFEVKAAKLVVSNVAVCNKQDMTTPIPEIKKTSPKAVKESVTKPTKKKSLFVLIDELQENGMKKGPMSDDEVQILLKQIENKKASHKGSYRCCGKTHLGLFEFRKHLSECHPLEYNRYFVSVLHQRVPQRKAPKSIMGFGIKRIRQASSKSESYLPKYEGEHFHLIYTPMGNKR